MDNGDFRISIQIFSGGFIGNKVRFDNWKKRLDELFEHFDIENIIIGWNNNSQIYLDMREYLDKRNTKMLLWYPVFSELGHFREFQPVLDYRGEDISTYVLHGGEKFDFYCPLNSDNLENIKDIYESEFGGIIFDGVFLDKIRYPSLANGINSLFTCFCPDCREAMRLYGIDVEDLIREIGKIRGGRPEAGSENTIRIRNDSHFKYKSENPIWDKFFNFRKSVIYRSVKELYAFFKEREMLVGLDVFAYSLGSFVGQDIRLLSGCSDFIKPMYYRRTWAPAGMLFEKDFLNKIFSFKNNYMRTECGPDKTYPADLALMELNEINKLNCRTQVYPGFEVNRNDPAPIYPSYINESLKMVSKSDAKGIVLSWDINNAPQENLEAVYHFFESARLY